MSIEQKKLQKKIRFEPHNPQREIIEGFNKKRDIRICAGIRFGKTYLSAYLALITLLEGVKLGESRHIWLVAPTYDLGEKTFQYLARWCSTYFNKV